MYKFIIVDDESVVRVTLSTTIQWEDYGLYLVRSFSNGKAALEFLKENPVDFVLTDIKMPIMDGLELMEEIQQLPSPPSVTVLSSYSEFHLVRKAFTLGAVDYVLKADIGPELLASTAISIKEHLDKRSRQNSSFQPVKIQADQVLHGMALGSSPIVEDFFDPQWCIASIEIDDFYQEVLRFGENLTKDLWLPLQATAQQIPRVQNKCVLTKLSYSQYLLYYGDEEVTLEEMNSICKQLQRVWKTYLNLSFSMGVSPVSTAPMEFSDHFLFVTQQVSKKFIFGRGGVFTPELAEVFSVSRALEHLPRYEEYITSLKKPSSDKSLLLEQEFYASLYDNTLEQARQIALEVIYGIALLLAQDHDALWNVFQTDESTDFYQKVSRLNTIRSIEIWLSNFTHWIADYINKKQDDQAVDEIEQAKQFIHQNYTDPDINITAIAEHVGYSEKYFSTLFNERMGTSFLSYLNELRISMAKRLLSTTTLRMYEISDTVGYNSVEHFTRVFKRTTGLTPTQYRQQSAEKAKNK